MFVFAEAAVRILERGDEDGNRTFAGQRLLPYRLPVNRVATAVRRYRQSAETMIIYDATLGWKPRPSGRNEESFHSPDGLRVESAERTFTKTPPPGVLRVALFGDSFVYGSEVVYPDSWVFQAGRRLVDDAAVELLNFGVPGYGTDQAYLRWVHEGSAYAPHVVVFGLQLENMNRNVNILRPFYIPTVDLPFSKPRFVDLRGEPQLINQPAVPPDRLPELIARIDSWELHQYEHFYNPARYKPEWWQFSHLLAAVPPFAQLALQRPGDDELTPQKQQLTFRILSTFAERVRARGARFLVVHLPTRVDLETLDSVGELPHRAFLHRVRAEFDFVDPAENLLRRARELSVSAMFRPGGHYTADGNAVVAGELARHLTPKLRERPR